MKFDPNKTVVGRVRNRIIPDWRSRLKDYSTLALAFGTGTVAAWSALPPDLQQHLPTEYVAWFVGSLNALGVIGKFIIQGPVPE